ncbi:membrane protein FAM174B isoform X1 [Antechinus flavipes]|uniref:membrane protein FAM174B isoform X1 n=2 Tax=Antechinus flavipes TaxID=38775 RepID=UPI0022364237|nr:membrane protein FAM174B isoform X1 [Antechinus flavipes]
MRALLSQLLLLLLLAPGTWASVSIPSPKQQPQPQPPVPPEISAGSGPGNATLLEGETAVGGSGNRSETLVTRISSLLRDLPTLKAAVIVACAFTSFLIACLLLRVFRSGKRIKKTRKYDIITTPAERVEMTPLNEEDDEEEDSTVFDVKYRYIYR